MWGHKRKVGGTSKKFSVGASRRHCAPHLQIASDATAADRHVAAVSARVQATAQDCAVGPLLRLLTPILFALQPRPSDYLLDCVRCPSSRSGCLRRRDRNVSVYFKVEYLKTVGFRVKLLKKNNRKPYTIYRMVPPLSMTLSDL